MTRISNIFPMLFLIMSQSTWALHDPNHDEIRHITASGLTKPLAIFSHATVYKGVVQVSCIQGFK